MSVKEEHLIDAPEHMWLAITLEDVEKSIQKDQNSCKTEGSYRSFGCAMEVCALRMYPNWVRVKADRTVFRAERRDGSAWRWILESDGRRVADLNDVSMEVLRLMKFPMLVQLISPIVWADDEQTRTKRETRSLRWGRSEEGRAAKRESSERSKEGTVQARGPYAERKERKGRDGRGYDNSWYVREGDSE